MHSCIAALLFILATLSSALDFSDFHQPPTLTLRTSPTPAPQCIERYTNYYSASYNYVFFNDPSDPQFNFTILTNYLAFYPNTLSAWLRERGFHVLNTSRATATDGELCSWRFRPSVAVDGRRHGQVGWKQNLARANMGTPSTGNSSSTKAVPRQYNPHDFSIKPRRATLERIELILQDNTPYADIYYFRSIMLAMTCGLIAFTLAWYALMCYMKLRQRCREMKDARNSDDIELDQIKVHDVSGSGMQRMDTDDGADGPKFKFEITRHTAANVGTSSVSSSADPPPMYSLDGAGRSPTMHRDMV